VTAVAVLAAEDLAELVRQVVTQALADHDLQIAERMQAPAWWTPTQVRAHARCSSATVFKAIAAGELPATSDMVPARGNIPGKRWRINPADARAWAVARARGAT